MGDLATQIDEALLAAARGDLLQQRHELFLDGLLLGASTLAKDLRPCGLVTRHDGAEIGAEDRGRERKECREEADIPQALADRHGLRRFGFHGVSHEFVARAAAEFLGDDLRNLRLITCHLGGGCSVCAIENGRSVETSMGMTPLEGLVMATRCGDIDPAILLHLMRVEGRSVDDVDQMLNRQSGPWQQG